MAALGDLSGRSTGKHPVPPLTARRDWVHLEEYRRTARGQPGPPVSRNKRQSMSQRRRNGNPTDRQSPPPRHAFRIVAFGVLGSVLLGANTMNKQFAFISVLASWVLVAGVLCAQGSMSVSNLDLTSVGSQAVAADSWLEAQFQTGDNGLGYVLNSVHFSMAPASGSTSGFAVSLYSSGGADPGSFLGSLNGPDPSAGGQFVYNAGGIHLEPESRYFLVMTAESSIADGNYEWNLVDRFENYDAVDGWLIPIGYRVSADGADWDPSRQFTPQFGVDVTVVPEPSTILLVVLGLSSIVGGRALRSTLGG